MVYDGISPRQLVELAERQFDPAVSIFLSTARKGTEVLQSRVRLKNLLGRAEIRLTERGIRHAHAIELMREVHDLDSDIPFWRDRLDGVALFIAEGRCQIHHLPFPVEESLHVAKSFYVRPVLPVLSACHEYYVLALEKNHVRLVHCGVRGAETVEVPDMPHDIDTFSASDHSDKQLQFHSAGPVGRAGSVIGHGAGDKGVDAKEKLHRFCICIARSLEEHLATSRAPVVLAGTDEFQDGYRNVSRRIHLLDKGVHGSPKHLTPEVLASRAAHIVGEFAVTGRRRAMAQYLDLAGTGMTSQQIEEILPAAVQGRIDVLFCSSAESIWGKFEASSLSLTLANQPAHDDVELINEAALATVANGGAVFDVERKELNLVSPVAAVYRF